MDTSLTETSLGEIRKASQNPAFRILMAISFSHLLNDVVQSLLIAIYPMLKSSFHLSFGQIGLITLTYQFTASLLQPLVGLYADRRPQTYSLAIGMGFTLVGLLLLSCAPNFAFILFAAALIGVGSSVFHPEASRAAHMASGGRYGMAQSVFMVGGNVGTALGPLLAALIILPYGQTKLAWFAGTALLGAFLLLKVGQWCKGNYKVKIKPSVSHLTPARHSNKKMAYALSILVALIFSKYVYLASLQSYYAFYLISRFQVSESNAQLYLFAFLFSIALGPLIGGPIGDKIGRRWVIWISVMGAAPFTLILPYANLFWTGVLTVLIGIILSSAFPAILAYAQELMPNNIGMVSGLLYGFAFGIGGIGAAVFGKLADLTSIEFIYHVCAFLPFIGALTYFLPRLNSPKSVA